MARRKIEVFSLSFLDVIACGFGAVVLFYTILSAQAGVQRQHRNDELQSEVNRLEEEVLGRVPVLVAGIGLDEQTRGRRALWVRRCVVGPRSPPGPGHRRIVVDRTEERKRQGYPSSARARFLRSTVAARSCAGSASTVAYGIRAHSRRSTSWISRSRP